jgi:hypothetical protein
METYKNCPIYGSAVPALSSGWYAQGIVFDPGTKMLNELQRLECTDTIFSTKEEAETHALMLCKSWIDQHLERYKLNYGRAE